MLTSFPAGLRLDSGARTAVRRRARDRNHNFFLACFANCIKVASSSAKGILTRLLCIAEQILCIGQNSDFRRQISKNVHCCLGFLQILEHMRYLLCPPTDFCSAAWWSEVSLAISQISDFKDGNVGEFAFAGSGQNMLSDFRIQNTADFVKCGQKENLLFRLLEI